MDSVKVLLVTFYFPPAGGAGVPRLLKLAEHLPELGIETHVLAPDDPKWLHVDESLEPPPAAIVHRAKNLGPRSRKPAEELAAAHGVARLGLRRSSCSAAARPGRGRGMGGSGAPPPPAVRKEGSTSSSPPRRPAVRTRGSFVAGSHGRAGCRPPRFARLAPHRRGSPRRGRARAPRRARADAVVAASDAIAAEMQALGPPPRLQVIANGCDFEDFEGLEYRPADRLRVTHAGSFFGRRDPRAFLDALARTDGDVVARFVGGFPTAYRDYADRLGLGDRVEVVSHRSRAEVLALQRDSDALLLLIPTTTAVARRALRKGVRVPRRRAADPAVVPPDGEAAALIRGTGAGTVVRRTVDGMAAALSELDEGGGPAS